MYEVKVKDEEILRVLMKVCDADREEATNAFLNEKSTCKLAGKVI
ncbi:hypothetical protein [Garciella nitratireducens]|nr:hypothetical protein [Garciella nitratireducens]